MTYGRIASTVVTTMDPRSLVKETAPCILTVGEYGEQGLGDVRKPQVSKVVAQKQSEQRKRIGL